MYPFDEHLIERVQRSYFVRKQDIQFGWSWYPHSFLCSDLQVTRLNSCHSPPTYQYESINWTLLIIQLIHTYFKEKDRFDSEQILPDVRFNILLRTNASKLTVTHIIAQSNKPFTFLMPDFNHNAPSRYCRWRVLAFISVRIANWYAAHFILCRH